MNLLKIVHLNLTADYNGESTQNFLVCVALGRRRMKDDEDFWCKK